MKLNIIFFTLLMFVIFICYLLCNKINKLNQQNKLHIQNEQILSQKIKDIYNEKIILEKHQNELKQEAKKDTFDWNRDISNTHVIKRLQTN